MNPTKPKKLTSVNSDFLRGVRVVMNQRIYKRTVALLNTPGGELAGGEKQAMVYLQQFFNKSLTKEMFELIGVDAKATSRANRISLHFTLGKKGI